MPWLLYWGPAVGKIERAFEDKLRERPEATVRLIVRVAGDVPQAKVRLDALGVTVHRSFALLKAVAATCSAQTALALLREPWVQSVEEDRQLFIQRNKA